MKTAIDEKSLIVFLCTPTFYYTVLMMSECKLEVQTHNVINNIDVSPSPSHSPSF